MTFQHLPIADVIMISATSPMFTVFFARWFLKEPILKTDLINIGLVFGGIILIVKPPFIFGWTDMYTSDPHAKACNTYDEELLFVSLFLRKCFWLYIIFTVGCVRYNSELRIRTIKCVGGFTFPKRYLPLSTMHM